MSYRILLILATICSFVAYSSAQDSIGLSLLSRDENFLVRFPTEPKKVENTLETRFGDSTGQIWTAEFDEQVFEVSVTDFSSMPVKMEDKELDKFYAGVCVDLFQMPYCDSGTGYDLFEERGRMYGSHLADEHRYAQIFLAKHRLYIMRVYGRYPKAREGVRREEARRFLDSFIFVHWEPSIKKFSLGLPADASQQLAVKR
jgi:hypothetical protein